MRAHIKGNEEAGEKAKKAGLGAWLQRPEVATPAGINQAFPIYTKLARMKWGLTYMITDHDPSKWWLRIIGRVDGNKCEYEITQNAVHLRNCTLRGDN